ASMAIACIGVGLPFVLLATMAGGLLEVYHDFGLINAVRIPMGTLMLAAPLAVLPFSRHLGVVTAVLVAVRIVNAGVLTVIAVRAVPQLRQHPLGFHRSLVRPLLTFGGWLTV